MRLGKINIQVCCGEESYELVESYINTNGHEIR